MSMLSGLPENWLDHLLPSDWGLAVFAALVLVFIVDYGVFSPWWRHPIGYVVLMYSISVALLVFLILWATATGARIDEWARQLVVILLILGIVGKMVILHVSRYQGMIERRKERAKAHYDAVRHSTGRSHQLITGPNPLVREPSERHRGAGNDKEGDL
jgi:multidrug efflux pump subunit AcrB